MTEPLFYSTRLADPGEMLTLAGEEAHHAAASRRLRDGETVWLFDGRGGLARTTLLRSHARGRNLELRVEERHTEPAPQPALHLACALPKGDRLGVLLDMATQLGMTRFTPLDCARSVVKAGANSTARWRKICLEACKQSRRVHLPQLETPATVRDVTARGTSQGGRVWIAHPAAHADSALDAAGRRDGEVTILVGPEGGFTPEELEQAVTAGARPLRLGNSILRVETAAVALLAAFTAAAASGTNRPGGPPAATPD